MSLNEKKLSNYTDSLNNDLTKKKFKFTSRNFLLSLVSIVAVVAICITTYVMLPPGKNNMVYAMTKAYEEITTNAEQFAISVGIKDQTVKINSVLADNKKTLILLQGKSNEPDVKVPFDLKVEENSQKSVDAGHSPWRLDPVFVSQVFVSLKLSPQGITGDYPIKTEDLKLIQSNDKEAIVEVSGSKTPIKKVYLKRLVRQDSTGIWSVVGYDPK